MHKIGLGRILERTPVVLRIHGLEVRVIHTATGEGIRELILNIHQRYHGLGT